VYFRATVTNKNQNSPVTVVCGHYWPPEMVKPFLGMKTNENANVVINERE